MLMKSDCNTSSSAVTACGNCGVEERRLLHHVRHRGIFRRLCTSCVLRLHPQYFCPTCFQVYIPAPSNDEVVTCYKCYSSAHSHCVSVGPASTPSPYVCPLCIDPNTPIFKLRTANGIDGQMGSRSGECRVMNREEAKKLLAAAKIASASMNKAAVAAKVEAERRAKEAAFTRKIAKEALEHVAYLAVEEKLRNNKPGMAGSGTFGVPQSKIVVDASLKGGFRNGIAASGGVPLVAVEESNNAVEEMNKSSQLLAALDADESMVDEQMDEIKPECTGSEVLPDNDIAVTDGGVEASMMVSDEDNNVGLASRQNNSNDGCENNCGLITNESIVHENVDVMKTNEIKAGGGSEICFDEFIEVMDGDVECARVRDEEDVGLAARHNNVTDSCHSSFVDENVGAFENESVVHGKMDEILPDTIGSETLADGCVEVKDGDVEGSERMNEDIMVTCSVGRNNGNDSRHSSSLDNNTGTLNGNEFVLHEKVDEIREDDIRSEALPDKCAGDVEGGKGMNEDSIVGCITEQNDMNDSSHSSSLVDNSVVLNVDELIGHEMKAESAGLDGAQVDDTEVMDGEGSIRVSDVENTAGFDLKQGKSNCIHRQPSLADGKSGAVDAGLLQKEPVETNNEAVLFLPVSNEMCCRENTTGKGNINEDQL